MDKYLMNFSWIQLFWLNNVKNIEKILILYEKVIRLYPWMYFIWSIGNKLQVFRIMKIGKYFFFAKQWIICNNPLEIFYKYWITHITYHVLSTNHLNMQSLKLAQVLLTYQKNNILLTFSVHRCFVHSTIINGSYVSS